MRGLAGWRRGAAAPLNFAGVLFAAPLGCPRSLGGVVRRPGRGQFRRAEGAGTRLNPEASVDSSLLLAQLGPWGAGGGVGGGGLSLVASLAGRGGSGSFYHACILTYGRGTQRGVMG